MNHIKILVKNPVRSYGGSLLGTFFGTWIGTGIWNSWGWHWGPYERGTRVRLHRHRPQIASINPNYKKQNKKGTNHTRSRREASLGDKAAAAPKNSPEWRSWRGTSLEDKAAAKSSPEWGSWRETSLGSKAAAAAKSSLERRSWRAKSLGDKAAAAAKRSPEWRWWRETNGASTDGSQEQARMEIMKGDKPRETRQRQPTRRQREPSAAQNGDHEGRQMKQDKAAAAAKSSPEWRSWRETNEARQGGSGSQEQPTMEIMKGDKWSKTRRQRQPRAAQRSWRKINAGRQGGSGITTIWRFWGSATQALRSMNPYSFQLSGESPCWERLETLSGSLSATLLGTPDPEPFHEPKKLATQLGGEIVVNHIRNGNFAKTEIVVNHIWNWTGVFPKAFVGNCIRNPIGYSGTISLSLSGTCQQPQLQSPVSELYWEP